MRHALGCAKRKEVCMEKQVRAHAVISGRVQGVFFRVETQRAAEGFGVFGWVRNKRDGTVEAVFEGEQQAVDAVLQWCQEGPRMGRVDKVKVNWQDYTGEFKRFDITY
jgi:acylphosphatase